VNALIPQALDFWVPRLLEAKVEPRTKGKMGDGMSLSNEQTGFVGTIFEEVILAVCACEPTKVAAGTAGFGRSLSKTLGGRYGL
jgi:hypothetical protein